MQPSGGLLCLWLLWHLHCCMAKKKKLEQDIPIVPVPIEMWDEMLARAGGDPALAKWIWSCWQARPEIEVENPLDKWK